MGTPARRDNTRARVPILSIPNGGCTLAREEVSFPERGTAFQAVIVEILAPLPGHDLGVIRIKTAYEIRYYLGE